MVERVSKVRHLHWPAPIEYFGLCQKKKEEVIHIFGAETFLYFSSFWPKIRGERKKEEFHLYRNKQPLETLCLGALQRYL